MIVTGFMNVCVLFGIRDDDLRANSCIQSFIAFGFNNRAVAKGVGAGEKSARYMWDAFI